ncbi:hypothetical protein, partial [Salmonella sp. SAL4360]|uniref:hypothetical protein n=1 Tax=Salmonella sp. SAL4360 TaxID=3159881 RepID=UPI00397D382A
SGRLIQIIQNDDADRTGIGCQANAVDAATASGPLPLDGHSDSPTAVSLEPPGSLIGADLFDLDLRGGVDDLVDVLQG